MCHQWSTPSDPQSRQATIIFCCFVLLDLKSGRTNQRTDNMCKNNAHYRPGLWDGREDQLKIFSLFYKRKTRMTLCKTRWADDGFTFLQFHTKISVENLVSILQICLNFIVCSIYITNKTGVINDPLGQPTVPASWVIVTWFWSFGTDGRTLCVIIVITTVRDCGRPRGSIYNGIFSLA